jgi:hypothetical protein
VAVLFDQDVLEAAAVAAAGLFFVSSSKTTIRHGLLVNTNMPDKGVCLDLWLDG